MTNNNYYPNNNYPNNNYPNNGYPQYPNVPVSSNTDPLHAVSILLSSSLVIFALLQLINVFKNSDYMRESLAAFGKICIVIVFAMWIVMTILIVMKKDIKVMGICCSIFAGGNLLTFFYNMALISWHPSFRGFIMLFNGVAVFASLAILFLFVDPVSARKIWFVPGCICSFAYLLEIDYIFDYAFTSFTNFLNNFFFPGCTIAFTFIFAKWVLKGMGGTAPARNYQPQYQQPVYSMPQQYGAPVPPQYGAPVPQPMYVPAPQQPAPTQQPVPAQNDDVVCPVCGNILSVADRFCSKCGTACSIPTCSGCGVVLNPGDKFCGKCGKPV